MEGRALADDRVAVLERDGRGRELLEAGELELAPRAERTSSVPARYDWPPFGGAGPDATSSSRTVAVAPSPSEMNVREMSARSGAPRASG